MKTKTKKNRKKNREIRIVTISFVLLFLGLSGYITYYSVTHKQELINNSYNGRQQILIAQSPVVKPREAGYPVTVFQFAVTLQVILASCEVPHEITPVHEVALV